MPQVQINLIIILATMQNCYFTYIYIHSETPSDLFFFYINIKQKQKEKKKRTKNKEIREAYYRDPVHLQTKLNTLNSINTLEVSFCHLQAPFGCVCVSVSILWHKINKKELPFITTACTKREKVSHSHCSALPSSFHRRTSPLNIYTQTPQLISLHRAAVCSQHFSSHFLACMAAEPQA